MEVSVVSVNIVLWTYLELDSENKFEILVLKVDPIVLSLGDVSEVC